MRQADLRPLVSDRSLGDGGQHAAVFSGSLSSFSFVSEVGGGLGCTTKPGPKVKRLFTGLLGKQQCAPHFSLLTCAS